MILRAPTENENAIATNPIDVMLSKSEASAFQMESKNRFFGGVYPEPAEGPQKDTRYCIDSDLNQFSKEGPSATEPQPNRTFSRKACPEQNPRDAKAAKIGDGE